MSTLGISIIALVVVVVAIVLLFNLWQSRGNQRREESEQVGRASQVGRDARHAATVEAAPGGADSGRRWQAGADQNSWARQRREPTLTVDDPTSPISRAARGPVIAKADRRDQGAGRYDRDGGDGGDGGHDGAADHYDRHHFDPDLGFSMSADDDDKPMSTIDDDLGPPEFEAPRLDPMPFDPSAANSQRSEPPEFEAPRFEPHQFEPSQSGPRRRDGSPDPSPDADPDGISDPIPATNPAAAWSPKSQVRPSFDDTRPLNVEQDSVAANTSADSVGQTNVAGNGAPADPTARNEEPDSMPAAVDLVVTLIPRSPVNAERLIALTSSLRHVGSKAIRIEIDGGQRRWIALKSGTMVGCLRCSVLLANRQGPLNAVELSDFSAAMESLAGQIGARFVAPDMNQVLRQARELDAVAARLDTQVDLGVEAAEPLVPAQLATIARKLDLYDRGAGRFAYIAGGGELIYSLMAGETSDMLSFTLDVPRTAQALDAWRSMVTCASSCAQLVGGRVVDAAGRGMSVGMIDSVGQQIDKRYRELADVGLKAGTPATLRVFN